jgi:hypothetical protein
MMDRLLHPAWFDAPVPLPEIVERYRPEVCVIAGDPNSIARQLRGLDHQFVQILIFESLMPRTTEMPRLPGEIVRAERLISELVEKHSSRMEDPIRRSGVWQSMLNRDEFLPDLERFLPFGLAIEIAIRGH